MFSSETTNMISHHLLQMGVNSAVNGLGAAAVSSPVGVVGGVCFGAISYAIRKPITYLCHTWHLQNGLATQASKIIALVLTIFGSYIPAWHIMRLTGYTFSLVQATWLAAVGLGFSALLDKISNQIGFKLFSTETNF